MRHSERHADLGVESLISNSSVAQEGEPAHPNGSCELLSLNWLHSCGFNTWSTLQITQGECRGQGGAEEGIKACFPHKHTSFG